MIKVMRGREVRPGVYAYTVPVHGINGSSREPLLDACRQLQRILGDIPDIVGVFRDGRSEPDISCPLKVGAQYTVVERDKGNVRFERYSVERLAALREARAA
jgi:hypothetical protein